jgi:hypothetical protein
LPNKTTDSRDNPRHNAKEKEANDSHQIEIECAREKQPTRAFPSLLFVVNGATAVVGRESAWDRLTYSRSVCPQTDTDLRELAPAFFNYQLVD